MTTARAPFDLMVIVDPRQRGVLDGLARLSERVRGDRIAIQLRSKDASDAELLALARAVAAVQPAMSLLMVNGRAAVARAIAAEGVHLPEASESVGEVRRVLAAAALVGCSCHDAAGVARRAAEGADYVLLGPIGGVPGKPSIGVDAFASAARTASVPVVALGGIASEADAERAIASGAAAIAIQRALLDPDAPGWLSHWLEARRSP